MYAPAIYRLWMQHGHPMSEAVDSLPQGPLSLALGNFDGVHIGHMALLRRICEEKAMRGGITAVWTFRADDTAAIKGAPRLTNTADRLHLFAEAGIDYVILASFEELRHLSPAEFVSEVLLPLHPCLTVCGFNYRFGHMGKGDTSTLTSLLAAHRLVAAVIDPVQLDGSTVNSTAIRGCIETGDMVTAAKLLGRPFSVCLPVVHGHKLGRKMGVPTVNQAFPEGYIRPQNGVYLCTCRVDGNDLPAIANIGVRPTVSNEQVVNCETHILDFEGDLYGRPLPVLFHQKLRDEIRFSDIEALQAQIRSDCTEAQRYFAAHPALIRR